MKVLVKKKTTRTYRGPFQLVWRRGSCLVLWAGHVEGSQVEWCWPCLDLQGHTNRKREREKDEQWLNGSTVNTSTAINYFLVKISKQGRPLKGGFRKFLFKLNICCTLQQYFFFLFSGVGNYHIDNSSVILCGFGSLQCCIEAHNNMQSKRNMYTYMCILLISDNRQNMSSKIKWRK